MREMEKEEALWEPETGMENKQIAEPKEEQPVESNSAEEFDIPDIPTVFSAPKEPQEEQETTEHIWNAKTAREQIKEAKKKYKQEKKRLREERRMRKTGRGKLVLTGILCALLGAALGAAVTWYFLQ